MVLAFMIPSETADAADQRAAQLASVSGVAADRGRAGAGWLMARARRICRTASRASTWPKAIRTSAMVQMLAPDRSCRTENRATAGPPPW